MKEVVALRTENGKTFDLGDGRRCVEICVGALHYKDDYKDEKEQWKDIDLTVVDNKITKAPYIAEIDGNIVTITDKKTGKQSIVELSGIGAKVMSKAELAAAAKADSKGKVEYKSIAPDVDYDLIFSPDSVKFQRTIYTASAAKEATFKISGDLPISYRAYDADGDPVIVERSTTKQGDVIESFSSKKSCAIQGGKLEQRDVVYPVRIDPEVTIQSSKCNYINEDSSFQDTVFTQLSLQTNDGVSTRHCLLQYALPSVLASATIHSATMSLYYYLWTLADPVGKTITAYKCRRQDWSSPTWNHYKSGSAWGTPGAKNTTTDIDTAITTSATFPSSFGWIDFDVTTIGGTTSLIENAIAKGIDLSVVLRKTGDEYASFRQQSYSDDPTLRPKLVINYTPPPMPIHLFFRGVS